MTSGGAFRAVATATPMPAPMIIMFLAMAAISIRKVEIAFSPKRLAVCAPSTSRIVPMSSVAKRPSAMADSASCRYLFAEISIFFLLRKPTLSSKRSFSI